MLCVVPPVLVWTCEIYLPFLFVWKHIQAENEDAHQFLLRWWITSGHIKFTLLTAVPLDPLSLKAANFIVVLYIVYIFRSLLPYSWFWGHAGFLSWISSQVPFSFLLARYRERMADLTAYQPAISPSLFCICYRLPRLQPISWLEFQ